MTDSKQEYHEHEYKPADIAQAFKFEPGNHEYFVEVKKGALNIEDLERLSEAFKEVNIHVSFAVTHSKEFSLRPVEGTKK